jgi:ribonuclease HI
MKKVQLITDGSCIGNPGPGGWACILRYEGQQRELTGCNPQTTNNRMELTAAVQGLRALKEGCVIELITLCAAAHKVIYVMADIMLWRPYPHERHQGLRGSRDHISRGFSPEAREDQRPFLGPKTS